MTVLTRFEPFREFSTLQDRINRVFRESYAPAGQDESLTTSSFAPAVDVYEDEHNVTLKIEVPGIDEKDIDVRIENNTLTVHGERKIEKEEKEENYRRVERQYGSFTRTFTLPTTVDAEKVSANYDKGVLKIALPKKAEAKPKQIKVNVGSREDPGRQRPQQSRVRQCCEAPLCGTGSQTPVVERSSTVYNRTGGGKISASHYFVIWQLCNLVIWKILPVGEDRVPSFQIALLPNYKITKWSFPCPSVGTNSP